MTLAASVLPTPASPSMKSGFSSLRARKIDVARARSPMYLRSRSRCSTSSIVAGEVTWKGYELRDERWAGATAGPRPLLRLLDRSLGQHSSQVLLVLGAGAQVAGRVQAVGCVLRRIFWLGAVVQSVLDCLRADWCRTDVRQPDAPATIHLLGRGADDRPVEETAAELDVLVRAVGHGGDDLDDDLVCRQGRCEEILEEILGRDRALVGHDLGVEHQSDGRVVARGVPVRDHATDRAHVADLVVTHLARDLREDRQLLLDQSRVLDRDVTRQRADAELRAVLFDVVELLDPVDIDERFGLCEAQAHQRDEAMAARQDFRVLAVFAQQPGRLLDRGGTW